MKYSEKAGSASVFYYFRIYPHLIIRVIQSKSSLNTKLVYFQGSLSKTEQDIFPLGWCQTLKHNYFNKNTSLSFDIKNVMCMSKDETLTSLLLLKNEKYE